MMDDDKYESRGNEAPFIPLVMHLVVLEIILF